MNVKRIVFIIATIAVVTAIMLGLSLMAARQTFGVKTDVLEFSRLSDDVRQDILQALGIGEAAELRRLSFGGPDKFSEYAVAVPCDDADEFLSHHPFIAENFKDMGGSDTLFHADIDIAGYRAERGFIILAVDDRDYRSFDEQNELIKRLGDFGDAAEMAFAK